MFIICDENDVVQDRASAEANLSRGYTFPNYIVYEVSRDLDIRIGDSYDGVTVTPNMDLRTTKIVHSLQMQIIDIDVKIERATRLKFFAVRDKLSAKKTIMESEKEVVVLDRDALGLSIIL